MARVNPSMYIRLGDLEKVAIHTIYIVFSLLMIKEVSFCKTDLFLFIVFVKFGIVS